MVFEILRRNKQIVDGEMRCRVNFEKEKCKEFIGSSLEKKCYQNYIILPQVICELYLSYKPTDTSKSFSSIVRIYDVPPYRFFDVIEELGLVYYFGKTKDVRSKKDVKINTEENIALVSYYNHSKNKYQDSYVLFGKYKPHNEKYTCSFLVEYEGFLPLPATIGRELYENLRNFTEAILQKYSKIQEKLKNINFSL